MEFEPVAIVGLGCLLPDAQDITEFHDNLRRARCSITEVDPERWDPADYYHPEAREGKTYSKIGGWVRGFSFDPRRFRIPPAALSRIDEVQQWAVAVCEQALCDAGCREAHAGFDPERCGVVMGNSMGGEYRRASDLRIDRARYERLAKESGISDDLARDFARRLVAGIVPISEDTMPGELPNIVAGRVAQALDLHGPNYVTDAACASSLAAVMDGCMLLQYGHVDWMLAGAADRSMDPASFAKFCAIGALSAEGSFPFDERASGFVMAEGVGAVVLRRLADALANHERVYAVIRGIGSSSDGRGKGIATPNLEGQEIALRRCYAKAGYPPDSVDMIEAHGTSTPVGDRTEVVALSRIFNGGRRSAVALGSVKSMLGHLKAAAGIASLVKTTLALHHREILPSAGFSTPNPKIPWDSTPFYVPTSVTPWPAVSGRPPRASVSSFGFGGTNFHLTLEGFANGLHSVLVDRAAGAAARLSYDQLKALEGGVFCFSGEVPEEVIERAQTALDEWLKGPLFDDVPTGRRLSEAAFEQFRHAGTGPTRLAVVATSWRRLAQRRLLLGQAADPEQAAFLASQGVFLHQGAHPTSGGEVAFLFPGQGSQYVGMLDDLGRRYRPIGEILEQTDRVLHSVSEEPLSRIMCPDPFPAEAADLAAAEERLKATRYCQPAMVACGIALLRLYEQHGLKPDMVGGHSLGEYTALVAAGVLSFDDALRAVALRGTEMASLKAEDPGAMASLTASIEEVQEILGGCSGYVIAANKNSPRMTVIAGETPAIEAALARCRERRIQTARVAVSHAFHSRIVAPADEPLTRFLGTLGIRPPVLPVSCNLDGGFYPDVEPERARDEILARLGPQMSSPVEWTRQVLAMHESGARVWVECGPKRALSIFNEDILAGQSHLTVTSNHPKQGGIASWLAALAKLWVAGREITLPALEDPLHTAAFQSGPRPAAAGAPRLTPGRRRDAAEETVLAAAAATSGYPRRLLTPPLELRRDLGMGEATIEKLSEHLGCREAESPPATLSELIGRYRAKGLPAAAGAAPAPIPPPAPPAAKRAAGAAAPALFADELSPEGVKAVQSVIVEVLSEGTGYPPQVLEPDLDLEGDLGIDSVKQAEALALVYERYRLPLPERSALPQVNTIAELARAVERQRAEQARNGAAAPRTMPEARPAGPSRQEARPTPSADRLWRASVQPLAKESAPLAIGAGLVVLSDDGLGLAEATAARLRQRGFTPLVIGADAEYPREPVAGFLHLAPAGLPGKLPRDPDAAREQAARASRAAFVALKTIAPGAFAVCVSRSDGAHGAASKGRNPLALGAHAVFKTFAHENPELRVRCYDAKPALKPATVARRLVEDLLEQGGPIEIGLSGNGRCRLIYQPEATADDPVAQLAADDVFLVSGGGGGITAACVVALAEELGGGRFALLGRTPLHPEAGRLAELTESELGARRQALAEEMERAGKRCTPVALENAWQPFRRSREVQRTLDALGARGAAARYFVCDVRDSRSVKGAVEACRRELGPPTVILHGAGLEHSRQIRDKSLEEFDRVHDVKVAGWWNLLAATRAHPVRLFTTFSSVVGGFGNAGQADYAAANAVLNALARQLAGDRRCRHLALAWTAWADTGMAARGSTLERLRLASVEVLPAERGAAACVRAMTGGLRGEVLVAGRLGQLDRWQSFQGRRLRPETSLLGEVVAKRASEKLVAHRCLERSEDLFLEDHQINGFPYLPGVMSLEGFAEAAKLLHPDLTFRGVEDLSFPLPVKLTGATKELQLVAETLDGKDEARVTCRWQSLRKGVPGSYSVHSRGVCLLGREPQTLGRAEPVRPGRFVFSAAEIYRRFFHGPSFQCLEGLLRLQNGHLEGVVRRRLPPLFADLEPRFASAPLVLEAAIQNAGLLAMIRRSVLALPTAIRRLRWLEPPPPEVPLYARSRIGGGDAKRLVFDCQVMDGEGRLCAVVEGLEFTVKKTLPEALQMTI